MCSLVPRAHPRGGSDDIRLILQEAVLSWKALVKKQGHVIREDTPMDPAFGPSQRKPF